MENSEFNSKSTIVGFFVVLCWLSKSGLIGRTESILLFPSGFSGLVGLGGFVNVILWDKVELSSFSKSRIFGVGLFERELLLGLDEKVDLGVVWKVEGLLVGFSSSGFNKIENIFSYLSSPCFGGFESNVLTYFDFLSSKLDGLHFLIKILIYYKL